jgi:hypothetical protein
MGGCTSKPSKPNPYASREDPNDQDALSHRSKSPPPSLPPLTPGNDVLTGKKSRFFPFYSPSPSPSPAHFLKSASSTPRRFFRRPFPPPSPAKHIKAVLLRRQGLRTKASAAAIPEEGDEEDGGEVDLDKRFGFSKEFTSRLEVGDEVGRGHFGYTCSARFKKGELKGHQVAVKVIPKAKVCLLNLDSLTVLVLELRVN